MNNTFLFSANSQFEQYQKLAEKTFDQLNEEEFFWKQNEESNSIAAIIRHMHGNMLSRWTDFLNTDGEKPWRNRDKEFDDETISRSSLMNLWKEGWACVFNALHALHAEDLEKKVRIRGQELTVIAAITRQLTHYAYHVGQIVYVGKYLRGAGWKALSIPKNQSQQFNDELMKKRTKN